MTKLHELADEMANTGPHTGADWAELASSWAEQLLEAADALAEAREQYEFALDVREQSWRANEESVLRILKQTEQRAEAAERELADMKDSRMAANKLVEHLEATVARVRDVTRWEMCPVEPEPDDDEPLYTGMLTSEHGDWVRWSCIEQALAEPAQTEKT